MQLSPVFAVLLVLLSQTTSGYTQNNDTQSGDVPPQPDVLQSNFTAEGIDPSYFANMTETEQKKETEEIKETEQLTETEELTEEEQPPEKGPEKAKSGGIDSQDDTEDSLADYVVKKVGQMFKGSKGKGDNEQDKSQQGNIEPDNSDQGNNELDNSERDEIEQVDSEPENSEPEISEPENSEPENSEPENSEPENSEPEINQTVVEPEPNSAESELIDEIQMEKSVCSEPDTLDKYNCSIIPKAVYDYFNNDVSALGMLKKMFKDSTVEQLKNCDPGSWCLEFENHLEIKMSLSIFFKHGPFCSEAMKCSLGKMLDSRYICQEQPLIFLANAVELLCDLKISEDPNEKPQCEDNYECYTRTQEALYVLYQDVLEPNEQHSLDLLADECNPYKEEVARSYLCADKCCQFAQQELLKRFELWDGLAETASEIMAQCNITDNCEVTRSEEGVETKAEKDYFDYYGDNQYNTTMDEEYYVQPELQDQIEEEEEEKAAEIIGEEIATIDEMLQNFEQSNISQQYKDFGDFAGLGETDSHMAEEDKTLLIGVFVAAAIMGTSLIFLIFLGYRRFTIKSRGYSKLIEDETKMLRNDYS